MNPQNIFWPNPDCPAKVYGFGERTIKSCWQRAGVYCQKIHEKVGGQSQLNLGQVQIVEIL